MNHVKETRSIPKLINPRQVLLQDSGVKQSTSFTSLSLSPVVKDVLLNINTIIFIIFIIFVAFFLYNCKYGIFKSDISEPAPYDSFTGILRV